MTNTVTVNGRDVRIEGERNVLELVRKAGIDLPTFCYHSELSVYGACRLCLVEVEGRGIVASCSTPPEPGMKLKTHTEAVREIRRTVVELLLANHSGQCPTCGKSADCKLKELAATLGVDKVRFTPTEREAPTDFSSPAIVREPSKCVLCGDCVRMCREVQGVGAIDFAGRGDAARVAPAYGKELAKVECVSCGQCARVCPTGALRPRPEIEGVWRDLQNPVKTVVAQIAPAVRVAVGEAFGLPSGENATGKIAAALKAMGFARVFDTSFTADLTVIEEGMELLGRVQSGKALPLLSSCCPAWVTYAEHHFPELLPNLSSCKSPQQMFGSLAKELLPAELGVETKDLVVVSIMPCTAKKAEKLRPELQRDGIPEVDHVLTTQELVKMIREQGLDFSALRPESLDLPMGFKTGAGVIFGASGGVTEAVLRFAAEKVGGTVPDTVEFREVRGLGGLREAEVALGSTTLKVAVVNGLANAKKVAELVRRDPASYHFVEVMACPGGCIGGAGQPVTSSRATLERRAEGIYEADKMLQLHKAQLNPYVTELYKAHLGEPGSRRAHELLHTHYHSRRRIDSVGLELIRPGESKIPISVCVGTSCLLRGSQKLLERLLAELESRGLADRVDVQATFCMEQCDRGPSVRIGEVRLERCSIERAMETLEKVLASGESSWKAS